MARRVLAFRRKSWTKDQRLDKKWGDIWNYFRPVGFEDILLCKLFELRDAKTKKMRIDELDDLIRYAVRYKQELEEKK